jgi:hypothetical protein
MLPMASKSAISPFGMVTVQFAVRINILPLSASTKVFVPAKLMTGNGAV